MKRNLIAVLIFSFHQVVFSNQLDFVGVGEKNKSYNLEFSLEKTALIVAQSSNSPFSISLEFKETSMKEDFDISLVSALGSLRRFHVNERDFINLPGHKLNTHTR